jgi:4-amino-4-deoxy-L-arabinose transferase-like glycosyltransferase
MKPEMITKLSFILYSLWGRIFGFELIILRALSVIVAVATYLLMHRLVFVVFRDSKIAVFTTLFIMLNPYMIGLNCFVYTDMIGILCIVAACLAIYHDNATLFAVSAAAAILCRQYFIFLTAAALLYYSLRFCLDRHPRAVKMTAAGIVSLLPLIGLILLWKGLGPDNEIRRIDLEAGFSFHPPFLTLYICQLSLSAADRGGMPEIILLEYTKAGDLLCHLFFVLAVSRKTRQSVDRRQYLHRRFFSPGPSPYIQQYAL